MATNLPFGGRFRVTCEYGRKNTQRLKWSAGYHTGIDLVGDTSKTVYATCTGTVTMAKYYGSYGNTVKIKDDETGNIHLFAHLKTISVEVGQRVSRTSILGVMGASGNVTAPHLHYEVRTSQDKYGKQYNPAEYMGIPNKVGSYNSKNYTLENNGLKYNVGQFVQVNIPVLLTGAWDNDLIMVDSNGYQFWIHKSLVKDNRIIARVQIIGIENDIYVMQVFSEKFKCREEYIEKSL